MQKLNKILAALLTACLMASLCGIPALAIETNLPDSFLIDDENGIDVKDTGEFFLFSKNLMPGDVITRTLTLRNLEQGEPFRLHLLGDSPRSAGPVDWLDNLHLQITLEGQTLYSGRLRGDGKKTRTMQGNGVDLIGQGVDLGVYAKGDQKTLHFTVTADAGHMSTADLMEPSSANIDWVIHAIKDAPPDPPKTGDAVRNGMIILLLFIGILCAIFYDRYRNMRRNMM